FDPNAGLMQFAKIDGFFFVDDGCRRIIFSPRQVNEEGVENKNLDRETDVVGLTRQVRNLDNFRLQPNWTVADVGDFDAKWERVCKVETPNSRFNLGQRLSVLTPHFAR